MNETVEQNKKQGDPAVEKRLESIRQVLLVLSGKGGVGKSTVAANLAVGLANRGYSVGLLDIDIHGPSIPGLLGLEKTTIMATEDCMLPVEFTANLKVMSIGFLLQSAEDAVIWRGPMKYSVIKQFLSEVEWGELDYLVVDSPPGTGDEPLSIAQMIGKKGSAVIVTTPQKVAVDDVRRSISFCRKLATPVTGIVENMSGFVCPNCGEHHDLFSTEGGKRLAAEMNVPFLGAIPIDGVVTKSGDAGTPVIKDINSLVTKAFSDIVDKIVSSNNMENMEKK